MSITISRLIRKLSFATLVASVLGVGAMTAGTMSLITATPAVGATRWHRAGQCAWQFIRFRNVARFASWRDWDGLDPR